MDRPKFDIQSTGRWGRVRTFQAPFDLVNDDGLVLKPAALSFLLPILRIANIKASKTTIAREITVKIGMKAIGIHAGLSRSRLSIGRDEARDKGFLSPAPTRKKYRDFGVNQYVICDQGLPLIVEAGKTLYCGNDIRYMTIPVCFVTDLAPWSLRSLTSSQLSVYFSVLWLASEQRCNEFSANKSRVQDISHLSRNTFNTTLDSAALRHLFYTEGDRELEIALLDPYTGQRTHPITNDPHDPANYYLTGEDGERDRRMSFNYTPEQTEAVLASCHLHYKHHGDNLVVNCVFHDETKGSLNIDTSGYFKCFGCGIGKGLHLTDLVKQALNISGAKAIKHIAKITGIPEARLQVREFKSKAIAVYQYLDEQGNLIKEKLRLPNKQFQWRTFRTRRKPLLYNAHLLALPPEMVTTVIVCEGERDCDSINALQLKDSYGNDIIATTSGSSTTWTDGHARLLRNKRVIILGDNDEPGQDYANAVLNSCIKYGMEWRLMTFWTEAEGTTVQGYDATDYLERHSAESLVNKLDRNLTDISRPWFEQPQPAPSYLEA